MKTIAVLLSILLAAPAFGDQDASVSGVPAAAPAEPGVTLPPLVITAPRMPPQEVKRLKTIRKAGGSAALSGTGLMVYAAVAATGGPIGVAAGLIFFGGLSAYLAHRRLQGHDDFGPTNAAPSGS